MGSKNNEPSIRFIGFTDNWEQCKFGDLYKVSSGYAFKYQDYCDNGVCLINGESIQHGKIDGSNINYLPEDFLNQYSNLVLKENDIVLGLNRPITNGNLKISKIPREFNDSLLYQRAGKINYVVNIDNDFSFVLLSQEILKHTLKEAVGSDQPFISTSKLNNWKMIIPKEEEERKKIGYYFSTLDNLITLHQRKLDNLEILKKIFLDKLFPKYKEVIPLLRFSGFNDDWEKCKLSNILTEFSIKSQQENQYVVLSSTNNGMEYREGRVSSNSNIGYKIIDIGHLVVSPQNLWLGNININYLEKGLVSPSYKTFKFIYNNQDFINPQLRLPRMLHEYKASSTQGASIVRRNLDIELFLDIKIKIPNIYEQTRIGLLFRELDNNIVLHQQKLKHLENLKKHFLNNMFI